MSNKPKGAKSKQKQLTPEQELHNSLANESDMKKVAMLVSLGLRETGENRAVAKLLMEWEDVFLRKLGALNAYALQYQGLQKKYQNLLKKNDNKNAKSNKS